MKKILIGFILLLGILALLFPYRGELEKRLFEQLLNTFSAEFFEGSLRLKSGYINRSFEMKLHQLEGTLKSEGGKIPLEVESLESTPLIPAVFSSQPIQINFKGLRPQSSTASGLSGRAEIKPAPENRYSFTSEIESMDLKDIAWLNPDNLQGSSGLFSGSITANGKFEESPEFKIILVSKDGYVQSKFFDLLLPYLPALPTKDRLAKLTQKNQTVPFRDGALRMELLEPHKMKIFLHIWIPDYNVELNLNFEIRIEETLSFPEIAQIMGFIKVSV